MLLPGKYECYPHKRYRGDACMGWQAQRLSEEGQLKSAIDHYNAQVRKHGYKSVLSIEEKETILPYLDMLSSCGWPAEHARSIIAERDYDTKSLARADIAFKSVGSFAAEKGITQADTLHVALYYIGQTLKESAARKYDPSQPRVPAGNSDGGEWTDGSGSGGRLGVGQPPRDPRFQIISDLGNNTPSPYHAPTRKPSVSVGAALRQVPDYPTGRRASAIYGETSGLTPQLKNPAQSAYDPKNWTEDSIKNLATARAYIGIVSERNPRVHFSLPPASANSIEASVWNDSVDAAISGDDASQLDKRVTNFFLRQKGVGRQRPEKWPGKLKVLVTVGPFNNVGGGDVPRGPNTYIDFYGEE